MPLQIDPTPEIPKEPIDIQQLHTSKQSQGNLCAQPPAFTLQALSLQTPIHVGVRKVGNITLHDNEIDVAPKGQVTRG